MLFIVIICNVNFLFVFWQKRGVFVCFRHSFVTEKQDSFWGYILIFLSTMFLLWKLFRYILVESFKLIIILITIFVKIDCDYVE
jgi:hypothetical protein